MLATLMLATLMLATLMLATLMLATLMLATLMRRTPPSCRRPVAQECRPDLTDHLSAHQVT